MSAQPLSQLQSRGQRSVPPAIQGLEYTGTDLSALCQELFTTFTRADQRRWGEIYVEGLATVPGRKSVRRIAQDVAGFRADQCLQQFVNQSPWEWEPVRARLAHRLTTELRPRAWVVQEAVFPKNGDASVGVARQYAHSVGALLNCQLGLAVSLVGDEGGCPVNWRLMLPPSWSQDGDRRARSHLPPDERHRTPWEHLLDVLDEMVLDWRVPVAPVIVEAHQESAVQPLLAGLEERGLCYLVRVPPNTAVTAAPLAGQPSIGPGHGRSPRSVPVADVAMQAMRSGDGRTLNTSSQAGGPVRSRFVAVALSDSPAANHGGSGRPYPGSRRMVAEWSPRRRRAQATWLTNLNISRLPDLLELIRLGRRTADQLDRMGDDCGLRHFEGRSYRGWQHHVTLASIAHAYRLLCQLHEQRPAGPAPATG